MTEKAHRLIAGTRIALGWYLFWAFIDKTFGLGFATPPEGGWIRGGSPTSGFLTYATRGPLAGLYQSLAGNPLIDVLFMSGLLGLGLALLLGIGLKVAGITGPIMMVLMWSSALPPEHNPLIDEHIIYALVLALMPLVRAGDVWGLGKWWAKKTASVPWLQ